MESEELDKFQLKYELGKKALEAGQYRLSVEHLEAASHLVPRASKPGGEALIWLVTAYQAAGRLEDAIALCQQLTSHPYLETRKQAKYLLYIMQAPQLKRPKEWLTEIPDLASTSLGDAEYSRGSGVVKTQKKTRLTEPEEIDLSQVNTQDNQFIWLALLGILLLLGAWMFL